MNITLPLGLLAPYSPDTFPSVRAWLRFLLEAYPDRKAAIREVFDGWNRSQEAFRELGEKVARRREELVLEALRS